MSKRQVSPTDVPRGLAHIQGMDIKAVLRRRGVYLRQRTNLELKEAALPLAGVLVKNRKKQKGLNPPVVLAKKIKADQEPHSQRFVSITDDVAMKYWEKQIHDVTILEDHFDKAVKKFLVNNVLPLALSNIQKVIDEQKSEKALQKLVNKQVFDDQDEADLINQAELDLEPYLQNMAVISGQEANKLIGDEDPYIPSHALNTRINHNVQHFTKSMLNTQQDHLTLLIQNGVEEGNSVQQISSAIKDDFPSYSAMQAERITRTEVLRASNQSALDAFKQSGVVEGKQWLTAGAVDECADYEGQIESLDDNFYSSDGVFQDGDPPLHPNCRCIIVPVLISSNQTSFTGQISKDQRKHFQNRIKELEAQIDKRTKSFKELKRQSLEKQADDKAYIKALEKYLKVESDDEQT